MKRLASICSLVAVLSLLGFGCGGGQRTAPEQPEEPATPPELTRFDPLEFERDREVIPDEYPQSGAITGRRVDADGETDESDGPGGKYGNVLDRIDTLANQTFRVQLFTSKLYGKAQQARTIAEEIFDRPVFVDYEVPYFKVRVGSFFNRDQAEDYQQRARAAGYDNAWVVMVNLGTRTSPPLYDSLAPETGDTHRGDFGPSDDE